MVKFLKKNWLILLILLLALGLRLWGVQYGLPGLFVGDEKSMVGGALKMIFERNVLPVLEPDVFRLLYYPVLIPWIYLLFFAPYVLITYLLGDFASVAEIRDYFIMEPSVFFLMARMLNAFFSTAVVFLIYLTTKRLFSKRAGLMAGLLYAVSFLPMHQGHFSKHWNLGAFFGLLVIYFAFNILSKPKLRNYLCAGLATGLAFFSDYVFALYGSIVVFIHFLLPSPKKLLSKKFWFFVLISLIIAGIGILTYPQEFERIAFGEDSTAYRPKSFYHFYQTILEVLRTLFYSATFIFILSLFGFLVLFLRNKKLFWVLAFIPLLCPFLYYFLLHFEPRYVLLFLPILGIIAGFGLDQIIGLLKIKSNLIISLICLIVIFLPLKNAIVFNNMISQEDPRNLAKQWIEENILIGSKIIVNSWEFNLIKNQECLFEQQKVDNMSLRSRDYVMMENVFPESYCVWQLDLIKVLPFNVDEYQYYIIDDYSGGRNAYLGQPLMERAELIKRFEGSKESPIEQAVTMFVHQRLKQTKTGPNVDIYRLKIH